MEFCQRWRAVGVLAGVSSGTGLSGPLARVSQSLAPTQIWSDVIGRSGSFLESDWSTRVPPPVQPPERNFVGKLEWQRRLADNGEDSRPQIFNKYLAKLAQNKSENKLPHSDKSETGESKWRDRIPLKLHFQIYIQMFANYLKNTIYHLKFSFSHMLRKFSLPSN